MTVAVDLTEDELAWLREAALSHAAAAMSRRPPALSSLGTVLSCIGKLHGWNRQRKEIAA